MLSARNQLPGKVKSIKRGAVMAEVVVDIGQLELVALISEHSAEALKLKPGDAVTAIIKATEVILDKS
jgi:molybdopterin-binding protein